MDEKVVINITNNGGINTIVGKSVGDVISQSAGNENFQNDCKKILWILSENKRIWQEFGPESNIAIEEPGNDNVALYWKTQKLETIIPNNNKILSIIEKNSSYFSFEDFEILSLFQLHCKSFESSCLAKQEKQIRFPSKFIEVIKKYAQ